MTKKRLRKLYNACRPCFLLNCRNRADAEWVRKMYDVDIKTVYYSFEDWYNLVRKNKHSGGFLSNEDIYYECLYHWHKNASNKLKSGFWPHVERRYPD